MGFLIILLAFVVLIVLGYLVSRFRRCPSNKILVITGKVAGAKSAKCVHGGMSIVLPLIQDYRYMSLDPMTIDIDLRDALSQNNIRVNVPSTFTIGVSSQEDLMQNAAERILDLTEEQINDQASDIILGQLRLSIATMTIEEINKDREKFLTAINDNVNSELNKIGLEIINVNVKDITDNSGYIEAIGQKAAAEAIQTAKIDVAEQEKLGAIGQASANREKDVSVAEQIAKSAEGKKKADAEKRINVAKLEAEAVVGENSAAANIAVADANLKIAKAKADQDGGVAEANAQREIFIAEKKTTIAELEQKELAQKEVDKKKIEIEAEAEAEKRRRLARGEADAIWAVKQAEAKGVSAVLLAKAEGYKNLMNSCGNTPELASTLLMIEKLPDIVEKQVEAIKNIKIDKITVWDSGSSDGKGGTSNFINQFGSMLPPLHEVAAQAGVELPGFMGKISGGEASVNVAEESEPIKK